MTKSEVLEYLERVRNAEAAVFACDEALHALEMRQAGVEQNMQNIVWPYKPEEIPEQPEKSRLVDNPTAEDIRNAGCQVEVQKNFLTSLGGKIFLGGCVAVLALERMLVLSNMTDTTDMKALFGMTAIAWVIGLSLSFTLGHYAKKKAEAKAAQLSLDKYKQLKQETDARLQANFDQRNQAHALAVTTFQIEYDTANRSWHIYQKAKDRLAQEHAALQKIKNTLVERRKAIYNEGVLYETFWNIVAVNQIRDYLRMSLCETLEGPTGAYAQYMQDVRAERICGTVRSLKDAMERGMGQILSMQASLVEAVNSVGATVENLDYSISGSLGRMSDSIQNAHRESLVQLQAIKESNDQTQARLRESGERANAYFEQANYQLGQLNQGIATSNFMQYLDLYGMVKK